MRLDEFQVYVHQRVASTTARLKELQEGEDDTETMTWHDVHGKAGQVDVTVAGEVLQLQQTGPISSQIFDPEKQAIVEVLIQFAFSPAWTVQDAVPQPYQPSTCLLLTCRVPDPFKASSNHRCMHTHL